MLRGGHVHLAVHVSRGAPVDSVSAPSTCPLAAPRPRSRRDTRRRCGGTSGNRRGAATLRCAGARRRRRSTFRGIVVDRHGSQHGDHRGHCKSLLIRDAQHSGQQRRRHRWGELQHRRASSQAGKSSRWWYDVSIVGRRSPWIRGSVASGTPVLLWRVLWGPCGRWGGLAVGVPGFFPRQQPHRCRACVGLGLSLRRTDASFNRSSLRSRVFHHAAIPEGAKPSWCGAAGKAADGAQAPLSRVLLKTDLLDLYPAEDHFLPSFGVWGFFITIPL